DSKYDGDPRWVYAVRMTDRPYAALVYPMAGNPGHVIEVEPVGSARIAHPRVALHVPAEPGVCELPLDLDGGRTNPVPVLARTLPQVLEANPTATREQPTRVTTPGGINGRIGGSGDVDHFRSAARKGKAVRFEVHARRFGTPLRSSLDSVLEVLTPK